MIVFSEQHAWQGDEAVQQILVFPTEFAHYRFTETNVANKETSGIEDVDDNNAGASYKLHAVKNSDRSYTPVIRCGVTGYLIYEGCERYQVPEQAIKHTMEILKSQINRDLSAHSK